ncbi:MAG: hypothetical protein AB1298_03310 [Bacteroidota bacterium]
MKNDDGTLVDFPADQLFDVQITKGANYGTILLPQWGDTTDEAWGVMQGFKFIADKQITESMVESTILVKTSSGVIAGSIQAGKRKTSTNKLITHLTHGLNDWETFRTIRRIPTEKSIISVIFQTPALRLGLINHHGR